MKAREGDTRPLRRETSDLAWVPSKPFRWLPRHGHPFCVCEWVTQNTMKAIGWWPVYLAVFSVLVVLVLVFGLPWVG